MRKKYDLFMKPRDIKFFIMSCDCHERAKRIQRFFKRHEQYFFGVHIRKQIRPIKQLQFIQHIKDGGYYESGKWSFTSN